MSSSLRLHTRTQLLLSHQLCTLIEIRTLQQRCRLSTANNPSPPPKTAPPVAPLKPQPYPEKNHKPQPLNRPIGQKNPPQAGENTGVDTRTWRERKDDLFNWDKHLVRRRELALKAIKPYFRELSALSSYKGKTFFPPRALFRGERALYFPNLRGYTLANRWKVDKDTTDILRGKISLVVLYSGKWAIDQTDSFAGKEQSPELQKLLAEGGGLQRVDINFEEQRLRAAILWMFAGALKKAKKAEDWDKYFVVRKGLVDDVRMDISFINVKVGYVYLVDWDCKIRWAGSGDADGEEREGLVTCAKRLIDIWRKGEVAKRQEVNTAKQEAIATAEA